MLKNLFQFKQTDRPWHLPVLAGICMGVPIMAGYFSGHLLEAKLASLAALVILHLQSNHLPTRMITLVACSFGIMLSYTIGSICSYHPPSAPIALGVFVCIVHISLYHLGLTKPPGNFFFIMVASVAICMPFPGGALATQIGYVGIGTMISCCLGLIYSLLTLKKDTVPEPQPLPISDKQGNVVEALILGCFVGGSLFIANLLGLQNPYWVPTTCLAIMQGISVSHIFNRGLQRVLGTMLGLVLTWALLQLDPSVLQICITIIVAQVLVEFLVVRNYAVAVVFITVLTIFLAEIDPTRSIDSRELFRTRVLDIALGSAIGCIGGWVLHNEQVRDRAKKQLRKTSTVITGRNG